MAGSTLLDFGGKRDMDKNKALESALAQIERQFGKGSIMRLGQNNPIAEIEATSTGSLASTSRWGSADCPRAGSSRSTGRNPRARPR
jgi:recombination protein RecA